MTLNTQQYSEEQLKTLEDAGLLHLVVQKHNPVQSLGTPVHGVGGMFSEPGVKPGMWNTILQPRTFANALPMYASEYQNELVSILTAQTASTGSNPTDVCGTAPVPGQLKKATVQRTFGKYYMSTEKVKVTEIGKLANRADIERQILNMASNDDVFLPDILRRPNLNFRSEETHQLYKLGTATRRAVAPVNITGDASKANTATEIGFIKEYDGLDLLIKTGYADVSTSVAAPAIDSLVRAWGGAIAPTNTVEGKNIVEFITDMVYSRQILASQVGLECSWALVMDQRLFRDLAHVWAGVYADSRYAGSAGDPINREASQIETRFNTAIRNQALDIQGVPMPVLFTAGTEVAEGSASGNGLVGNVYVVPLTANGEPITYYDYFPLNNQFITGWNGLANTVNRTPLNNGLYLTAIKSDGFCDELVATMQPRLMLDAPFLAAKLTSITFDSYVGYRDWRPGGTFYYGGGATVYNG